MTPAPSTRPAVSVVVPFAGDAAAADRALALLRGLDLAPGDERILADNCGIVAPAQAEVTVVRGGQADVTVVPAGQAEVTVVRGGESEVTVVRAGGERSPAHARNTGARLAQNPWILFLDADVLAPPDLLERFFAAPIDAGVGALTGEITGYLERPTLVARYGVSRNFLGQRTHLAHPYRPRASSANLLVRRAAFASVRGYVEGVRAAEDTDFTWRLQEAGWTLGFRPEAAVRHRYRDSLTELGRQWRGYAAGAAWLAERYPGFSTDPGLNRLARRLLKRVGVGGGVRFEPHRPPDRDRPELSRSERLGFFCIDCYLGVQEQIGRRMSNRAVS